MKAGISIILAIGALALGVSGTVDAAQAAKRHCTSEECACEAALRQNTIEALEAFLKKYPQSMNSGRATSACAALGVPLGDGAVQQNSLDDSEPVSDGASTGG